MDEQSKNAVIRLCYLYLYQHFIQNSKPYKMGQYPAPKTNKGGLN